MTLPSIASLLRPSQYFTVRGGVHPETRKNLSSESAIEDMPIPSLLRIPLQQHIGAEAEPMVKRDDHVLKGQLIGKARGPVSANIHAPTSGRVIAVGHFAAPHPSALPVPTITIRPDGEDTWGPRLPRLRPENATPEEIAAQVAEAGIVGMGGATFPAAVKLNLRARYDLHTLVINGAECEPYLTCDDRLMRERAEDIYDGIGIMARALGVRQIVVAIESNKPQAIAAMQQFDRALGIPSRVQVVPTQYPMGSEKHLVKTITGRETPARALTADLGVVVHNAGTAHAVHLAVRYGEPLISRVVTVSGRGVKRPANVRVLIGTPVAEVLEHCGGLVEDPDRLLLGGPMMGQPIQNRRVPVVKGTSGILALTAAETPDRDTMPCIRCGRCAQGCPVGLTPFELNARIQSGDLEGAVKIGLLDCLTCGCCSFACPSNIPLVQTIHYAKGKLAEEEGRRHQQEEAKRLAAARKAREEAAAEAKRQMMAKRKAEMAAKKKREAEAAARAASAETPPDQAPTSQPQTAQAESTRDGGATQ
ncbi:electron transport complex subunit RsxC [Phaeovulum vinaykumarii]|uniref:Ion-translocating oxidoreductase complex subunit C n=1 Tax=Phaeovulum vinaykumarii TaxID=407234 RepID=A0A1N7M7R6_9RHOB|nr:electron transport complex subunit RsxC [Phaeovulum vinaykumarii]SIS82029.1 electron transport complex protein RnfC [Phaeovulum vinaykumarii]SOC11236.1 electron transport complex protein RnfC [Phaeovulum vinaykumarii]